MAKQKRFIDYKNIDDSLFEAYCHRADILAKRYLMVSDENQSIDLNDLKQEAYVGLAKIIDMYQKNPNWKTPLTTAVDNQIKLGLERYLARERRYVGGLNTDGLIDELGESPERIAERTELIEDVRKAVSTLSGRRQDVVCMNFGMGDGVEMTYKEIGTYDGTTRSNVAQKGKTSLRRLGHEFRLIAIRHDLH